MVKTNKKLLTLFLAAVLTVSAGFALLLTRPAEQASADEPYSETWVIKEDWTGSENFSVSVPFSLNGLETTFSSFSIEISDSSSMIKVKEGDSEKYISYCFSQGNCSYFNTLKDISDTPFGSTVDYITWKDGFGKITFLADTSETEYAVLRSWLNANAVRVGFSVVFKDGANELKSTIVNENAKADTIDLTDINTAKTGYTFKGWSRTNGGAVVDLANETITADTTYYAVYEKNANNVLDDVSSWLTSKTGIAFSATGVIALAFFACLLLRKK